MTLPNLPRDQIQAALVAIDQALYNHEQWCEALYATLMCRLAPDDRDIASDAHRNCRFGQWLYGPGSSLAAQPGFAEIELEHMHMHESAAKLLLAAQQDVPLSVQYYERFVNSLKRMRLEIQTVRRDLEDAFNNLDPLTGASNRIGMLTKLREQQEMVKRKLHTCSIAMMDVDHFKVVNDTHGHLVGDRVLSASARHVLAHLRPYDRVFRYGGEEFLILLPATDQTDGYAIVGRLGEELASIPHDTKSQASFHVTASFGLTLLDADVTVEQSIDRADKALYAAKTTGRNRTVIWDPSMG
jgi:diguanylate cyclase